MTRRNSTLGFYTSRSVFQPGRERPNNLIGLLFWLGFRRTFIPYERRQRIEGRSAWTIAKKLEFAIMFSGALTSLGSGIVGQYLWLALQNSRAQPGLIVAHSFEFPERQSPRPS